MTDQENLKLWPRKVYMIDARRDLFGNLIVTLHYGRIGTRGHTKNFIVPDALAGAKLVRACLKRRHSAPKRIGVAYETLFKFDSGNWAYS